MQLPLRSSFVWHHKVQWHKRVRLTVWTRRRPAAPPPWFSSWPSWEPGNDRSPLDCPPLCQPANTHDTPSHSGTGTVVWLGTYHCKGFVVREEFSTEVGAGNSPGNTWGSRPCHSSCRTSWCPGSLSSSGPAGLLSAPCSAPELSCWTRLLLSFLPSPPGKKIHTLRIFKRWQIVEPK